MTYAATFKWAGVTIPSQTGYYIYKNGVQVADIPAGPYTIHGLDCSTTLTFAVAAHDATGNTSPTATIAYSTPACGDLPPGVTLQAIDGGPNYFADNGFTNATSTTFNTNGLWAGLGWDSPDFIMIGQDYAFSNGTSITTFRDLGLNTSIRVTSPTDPATLRAAGIYMQPQGGEWTGTIGTETTGFSCEEPSGWTAGSSSLTTEMQSAGAGIIGRYYQISTTHNQASGAYGDFPGDGPFSNVMKAPVSIPGDGSRHLDLPSMDIYYFAKSGTGFLQTFEAASIYPGGPFTTDQMARGTNYGDLVDVMRSWVPDFPAPCAVYLETEDGASGTGSRVITPPELNWAVWSQLIHGARRILYFSATSNFGSGPTFGFPTTNITAGGQTRSIYDQAKATHALIRDVARIINSPFAVGYVTHTAGGYTFPTPHLTLDNGLDIMTKRYAGGSFTNTTGSFTDGYYIFACVRGSAAQTNVSPTFTLAGDTPDATTIPVIRNAGLATQATGTVTITNNSGTGHTPQFTDTFATAYATHIYGPITP